jgi:hypothetical protein
VNYANRRLIGIVLAEKRNTAMKTKRSSRARRTASGSLQKPRIDLFKVKGGQLGPVPKCQLEVRPLTVFVGRQGTGKSLVAQVLYALDELPYLTQFVAAREGAASTDDAERLFARILDQLRSAERRFAGFAAKENTQIGWQRGAPWEIPVKSLKLDFTIYRDARRTYPSKASQEIIRVFGQKELRAIQHAVFVPTERMVVSQLRSALAEKVLALPITYELFAVWLDAASTVQDEVDDPAAEMVATLSREALAGYSKRVGKQWKWVFYAGSGSKRRARRIDLDMASSGQRANWSLGFLGRGLFALRKLRNYAKEITIFVEEPELHLHPSAEVKMTHLLALLVNSGFRVVITTHSLNTLYALNNLLLAGARLGRHEVPGAPDPSIRLASEDVAVYAFGDGAPRNLVDRGQAFIDEHELGDVGAELGTEMNYVLNLER